MSNCLAVVGRWSQGILGTLWPRPLRWGSDWPARNTVLHHLCYHTNIGHSRSSHRSVIIEIRRKKIDPSRHAFQGHSRLLELTCIDRQPMTSYYWSIVTMGVSCTVSEINGDFGRQSQFFFTFVHLTPPQREFPLEYCNGGSAQKTRVMPLQMVERVWRINVFIRKQYQSVTERRICHNNTASCACITC